MSYADLTEAELRGIADMYAIDLEDDATEQDVLNRVSSLSTAEVLLDFPQLEERLNLPEDDEDEDDAPGLITSDATPSEETGAKKGVAKKVAAKKPTAAAKKAASAKPAAKTVVPEEKTLLKMTRNNPVYEVRGYRFTRNMPYAYVNNNDVDFLIEVEDGFVVAKPSEVEKFFG